MKKTCVILALASLLAGCSAMSNVWNIVVGPGPSPPPKAGLNRNFQDISKTRSENEGESEFPYDQPGGLLVFQIQRKADQAPPQP